MFINKDIVIKLIIPIILFGLILGFGPLVYRNIIKNNKENLPSFVRSWIEARDSRQEPSPIVYKDELNLRVIEGWTLNDISKYISDKGFNEKEFEAISGTAKIDYRNQEDKELPFDYSEQFSFLQSKPTYYGLEGFLFPDTYRVYTDASSEDLVLKMLRNFDSKLSQKMRDEIERQDKSIYEIIIMASLIEKEAPIDYNDPENTDARIVSDIFWSRLDIGQALQSDATLWYWFNDNNPAHSASELDVDTPYNSYKYAGLPPTPICNPGLKAIEAAIYPIDTSYNYFLTNLDGENIYYATTYQEHLNNKYKYLK